MTALTAAAPRRSAFAAAFLSLIFPGLGQAYAGAPRRGAAFAAIPLAILAVFGAIFLHYGTIRFGFWLLQSNVLLAIFILNVVLLVYRLVAVVDAYRLAQWSNAFETTRRGLGRPRVRFEPASLLGLLAIVLVIVAGHLAVAKWDRLFYDFAVQTHQSDTPTAPQAGASAAPTPAATIAPWNGTDRLNILLVGVDARPADQVFNTDTMMVVSIDPQTKKVAMLSLPRDVLGAPTPPGSRLARLFGPTFNAKINALWMEADAAGYPGGGAQALKDELGYIYGLDIKYYVEVNFQGFEQVVDAFGGVTIKVDSPVVDENYPADNGTHIRVYIGPGLQHMTGAQALIYARSRHGSNDFDRALRQQKVLTSLKAGADMNAIERNLVPLIQAVGQAVHTDLPEGPDVAGSLLELAGKVKQSDIKQYVFSPTNGYGVEHNDPQLYWIQADYAKIKAAVQAAFAGSGGAASDSLQAAVTEQAPITVENGTGVQGQAGTVADYLSALGLNAAASNVQPAQLGGPTVVQAVNGGATQYPATAALITSKFGKAPAPVTIAGESPGFIVITGSDTPALTAPPSG